MIILLASVIVPKENQGAFFAIIKPLVEETRKEVGCFYYDLMVDVTDPTLFTLVEKYADDAAVEAHRTSAHFTTYIPQIEALSNGGLMLKTGQVLEG